MRICLFYSDWGHFFSLLLKEREERREGGRGVERDRETLMWEKEVSIGCQSIEVSIVCALNWDGNSNLGMCPDQESNPRPSGL